MPGAGGPNRGPNNKAETVSYDPGGTMNSERPPPLPLLPLAATGLFPLLLFYRD